MSTTHAVIGHDTERGVLLRSVARNELPPALLFVGPAGIGKQRVALWLAQRLLCERPAGNESCGSCTSCRLALHLEHPDVHWFFPLPRPKVSGGADRMGDALEDARAAELEARREDAWYPSGTSEIVGIYLAHAQIIRRVAGNRPSMSRRKVLIIGDAEMLVPQEASPEAANALLKLLEEPPPDTNVLVTSSDAEALLPTIRSRLPTVRLRPLPLDVVADVLVRSRNADAKRAALVARLAEGSIGRALAFLGESGNDGPLEGARRTAREWLGASVDAKAGKRFAVALEQAPAGARGGFTTTLQFLILWLRDLGAVAAGADYSVSNADAIDWLHRLSSSLPHSGPGAAAAIQDVESALTLVQFDVNPQLAVAELLRVVGARLRGEATTSTGLAGVASRT